MERPLPAAAGRGRLRGYGYTSDTATTGIFPSTSFPPVLEIRLYGLLLVLRDLSACVSWR
jgi:hypothetical protein